MNTWSNLEFKTPYKLLLMDNIARHLELQNMHSHLISKAAPDGYTQFCRSGFFDSDADNCHITEGVGKFLVK